MSIPRAFFRIFFVLLSVIFVTAFAIGRVSHPTVWTYLWGGAVGVIIGAILIGCDLFFKRFSLRSFNITMVGLFFGYLMGLALLLIFDAILDISGTHPTHLFVEIVKIFIFLFGTYLGVMMTLRASDELYVSLPFIKFTPTAKQKNEFLLDLSALNDPRIIDLATSGLLDNRLVIPRFLLRELQQQEEDPDEITAAKAKRALETIQKLETLPELHLHYQDTDFPEIKEISGKVLRLARLIDADILTSEISRIQRPQVEGVKTINLHALAHALKPLMQQGESLKIKIQRHGKEELQGVGYLEDGTMVVINGGGEFVGETVSTRVLSVKHTASGRIIFCNVADNGNPDYEE